MFRALGNLRFPFVAGSAATIVLCILYFIHADMYPIGGNFLMAIVVGGLLSVVLYAVMRTFAGNSNGASPTR
jgi:hypothetical protein